MSLPPRPYILSETNWKEVRNAKFDIAVLPWGATEAHNFHLPYGTDNYQVEYVAREAAGAAWDRGCKLIVLPCIPFGVNTGQMDVSLCINMNPSTQLMVLKDICEVLSRQGIGKLVILNGHGANNFIPLIRELALTYPNLIVCCLNWYQSASKQGIFELPGDHADEMETSAMMHIAPEWVLPLSVAGDGRTRKFKALGFREGWAWTQRPWTKVTRDTGSGDPSLAQAEKGDRFLKACISKISDFFCELGGKSIDELLEA